MKYIRPGTIKRIAFNAMLFVTAIVSTALGNSLTVSAYTIYDRRDALRQTPYFNWEEVASSCTAEPPVTENGGATSTPAGQSGDNKDYAGRPVFTQAQLDSINANKGVYESAAGDAVPWQMLAVIHMRETGLARTNPGNGQGLFQFADQHGGPYPAGPVDEAEFLRQAKLAAEFLVTRAASSNYTANRTLGKTPTTDAVKDTFFTYNGRAGVYADQAGRLGFDPLTQGYEGSPYVMNKADAKRDPGVAAANTWGQIKRDYGGIEYPANADYGAFVQYAAMAGISTTGGAGCSSANPINCTDETADLTQSNTRRNVVCLAQKELGLWNSGELTPGTSFLKYTGGQSNEWCAWFVSWIYNQAGYPFDPPVIAAVNGIEANGRKGDKFFWHDLNNGYVPVPGDVMIQSGTHTSIVISVNGNQITTIGGNQGGTTFSNSKVTIGNMTYGQYMNGFVSPDNGGGNGNGLQPI